MTFEDDRKAILAAHAITYGDVSHSEVVIADGYEVSLRVRDGCLVVHDGFKAFPRARIISPIDTAKRHPQMIMVMGSGFITTEAMGWCQYHDIGLAVLRIDQLPTMLSTKALYARSDVRRRQAKLAGTKEGIAILRHLTELRIHDMATIAGGLDEDVAVRIKGYLAKLPSMRTTADVHRCQGWAAKDYWESWRQLRLRFAWRAPKYYAEFWSRKSENSATNVRNNQATRPLNALLNYGYKVAETQAALAMISHHLDPAMGISHVDPRRRTFHGIERLSGALDLLEVGRSAVERHVLELVRERRFGRADFRRLPEGVLRVGPPLSHEMAQAITCSVRPVLYQEAKRLAGGESFM